MNELKCENDCTSIMTTQYFLEDNYSLLANYETPGREIAPNTGANAPKFFTLATKS